MHRHSLALLTCLLLLAACPSADLPHATDSGAAALDAQAPDAAPLPSADAASSALADAGRVDASAAAADASEPGADGAVAADAGTPPADASQAPLDAGGCLAGGDCDDQNPCTDDSCSPEGTCLHADNAAPCDDGVFCNGADTCGAGACAVHAGNPCAGGAECARTCNEAGASCAASPGTPCTSDGNVCTDDACDGSGRCAHLANSAPCDDGQFCNGADTCSSGSCAAHAGDPCAGGSQCNATCNEAGDRCSAPAGTPCSDLAPADCHLARCDGAGACDQAYASAASGAACDDGAFCDGADHCDGSGGCTVHAGDPCAPETCSESGDVCLAIPSFVELVAGRAHACGLTTDGRAYCWGRNDRGQLGAGAGAEAPLPVAVDSAPIAGSKVFVQLAAGDSHTCGVTDEGVAYCWGADSSGQLGHGGAALDSPRPSRVDAAAIAGEKTFVQLAAGGSHTCGLTGAGVAYCWGSDAYGQLGTGGANADAASPAQVETAGIPGNKAFRKLAAGESHTCGIAADGVAWCWGRDHHGQLGDGGTAADAPTPSAVDVSAFGAGANRAFVQLVAGLAHTCGRAADGRAYCWGHDGYGQRGDGGPSADALGPVAVDTTPMSGLALFAELAAGANHTCGRTAANLAYCWGRDDQGQLGDGSASQDASSPALVSTSGIAGNPAFVRLVAGESHTCGRTADGATYCWGSDGYGQLGNGAAGSTQAPAAVDLSAVPGQRTFVQVTSGAAHTCGLTARGIAYCWGGDAFGSLGNGGTSRNAQAPSPVDTSTISGNMAFVQLSAGGSQTCGLTGDGAVYCWGDDTWGKLGDGATIANKQSPSRVGLQAVVRVEAGSSHSCALIADGAAYCWGYNGNGAVGSGVYTQTQATPIQVATSGMSGNDAFLQLGLSVQATAPHTCGLAADGAVYCWGRNIEGQLGLGTTAPAATVPGAVSLTAVTGNQAFTGIWAGGEHTCAVTAEGVAYCWGSNGSGALGRGPSFSTSTRAPGPVDLAPIAGTKTFGSLAGGGQHTCGVTTAGVAYCWGSDNAGQLGNDGAATYALSPLPVTGPGLYARLDAGSGYTCGFSGGLAFCWGSDGSGELGNGASAGSSQVPVAVDPTGL